MTGTVASKTSTKMRSLTVLHSPDPTLRGRVISIGKGMSIGRSADAGVDLAVNDKLLSRRHASVTPLGAAGACELVDHDSRNGSFVDGLRITKIPLTEGNIIRLGVTLFELTSGEDDVDSTLDDDLDEGEPLVGKSARFRALMNLVAEAARSSQPATLIGEAGTGKKRIAKRVHTASGRPGRFVVVHCGNRASTLTHTSMFGGMDDDLESTSSDGFIPMAAKGTLLLHEVDLLSPALQDAVLELIDTGRYHEPGTGSEVAVDVRIIGTSGTNLQAAVDAGAFSRSLYEKLSALEIELPSLRSRKSDIPLLAQHFLKLEAPTRRLDWSATCLEKLLLHDWPNNVRELHNVMRRLTLVDEGVTTLRSAHLPREFRKRLRTATDEALKASAITIHAVPSREELATLLTAFKGDVAQIAEHYAKDRRLVYRWLSRHDLSASDFRD